MFEIKERMRLGWGGAGRVGAGVGAFLCLGSVAELICFFAQLIDWVAFN